MPFADKILEEIAVVARDLYDPARVIEPETSGYCIRVCAGMREPAIRIGGKIGVVGKDDFGGGCGLQLNQKARRRRPEHEADKKAPSGSTDRL